jgi:two-component system, LytTR family, sensor kinase
MTATEFPDARVPARSVFASIVAVWLCYFVLATARGWLFGLGLHDALLWRRALVIAGSIAVTAALWPLLRLLDARRVWQQLLAVMLIALPAALLLAQINQWAFADVENQVTEKIGEREGLSIRRDEAGNLLVDVLDPATEQSEVPLEEAPPAVPQPQPRVPTIAQQEQDSALTIDSSTRSDTRWLQLTDVALGRYFLLLAWAALYFALVKAEQARVAERREGEYRRAAKAAELQSLRYQVNPHFLFNTLNSLSALVITGKPKAAETMIQTLSNYYRRSLAEDPAGEVTLGQEIEQQRLYLELESVRFPERLVPQFDIPEDLTDVPVPGMILQPLVENSVRYAVAPTSRAVTVNIAARAEYGYLVLTVSNDGPGVGKDARAGGFGIGLANVRDRLAARFGEEASVTSGPAADGGWRTVIRLPLGCAHD